jgi:PilZ domain
MPILVIRKHKRFAVRRRAQLGCAGRKLLDALLIELSLEGCRISAVTASKPPRKPYSIDQLVSIGIDGFDSRKAHVRWENDGTIGLRFAQPLHNAELDLLIRTCRSEVPVVPLRQVCAG